MIVKKIPAMSSSRRAGGARAKHVRALVDYMRTPDKASELKEYLVGYFASQGLEDGAERLIQLGARNFVCDDIEGQRAEMMAVAQAAVRSLNPLDHWLLSWRENEIPTSAQVDETIAMFVEDLGLMENQVIYAVHGDTHNRHAHIAINRFNPRTGKVITINKGFYREAAHASVARIVDRFGWEPEAKARYVMRDGEPVLGEIAEARRKDGLRPLRAGASAREVRTGYRSAQRIAQDDALPIILRATSWSALHAALAGVGICYDAVGTHGAVLIIDREGVKASDVSRKTTIGAISKRLGPFQPRGAQVTIAARNPAQDIMLNAFRADEYRADCERWRSSDKIQRRALGLAKPAPDLETYLHRKKEIWFAERWRNRNQQAPPEWTLTGTIDPATQLPQEIDGYLAYPCSDGTRYARADERTAFIDRGASVVVVDKSDEALLAALRLATMKFGGKVMVKGDRKFQLRVYDLASQHGLGHHVANPDFPAYIEAKKRANKSVAPPSEAILPERRPMESGPRGVTHVPAVALHVPGSPLLQPLREAVERNDRTATRAPISIAEGSDALDTPKPDRSRLRRFTKGPSESDMPIPDPRERGGSER